jgi:hypothetical protein
MKNYSKLLFSARHSKLKLKPLPDERSAIQFPLKFKRGRPFGSKTKNRNPLLPVSGKHDAEYWYDIGAEIDRLVSAEQLKPRNRRRPTWRLVMDFMLVAGDSRGYSVTERNIRGAYSDYKRLWEDLRRVFNK